MPKAHRNTDLRACSATTSVVGQSTVKVNSLLWAVKDDPNSHGAGNLINTVTTVRIEGKLVIVHSPDPATGDLAGHLPSSTKTAQGSPNVYAYG